MPLLRNRRAALLTSLIAIAGSIGLAVPATAATQAPQAAVTAVAPAATADGGWLRLGHFSPDTKAVDVRVSALRGGSVLFELNDVAYGDVSTYQSLAPGSYTISMVAAGSTDWTNVALSDTVTVDAASATTVAAYGPSADLKVRAFSDDLAGPTAGNARIRLVQASTLTPTVDVSTTTGLSIARGARAGSATAYAEVPAGNWTLSLTGQGTDARITDSANVDVAAGSVTTLFVLDTADGGLTILPILDSAASPVVPDGGVQTGGGWLASEHSVPATERLYRLAAF